MICCLYFVILSYNLKHIKMKTLDILIRVLLVTLMLLSVIGAFYYSETIEQFTMCWFLLMLSGVSALIYNKQSTK
jgi:hypothetical protein